MLDDTNIEILKILQEKARIPNVEVSRLINLAPSAVLERIRKMEHQGIIDGYEVRLNPESFNRSLVAFIQIYCSDHSDRETIGTALAAIDAVLEVHFIAGDDCYLVKVRVADMVELDTLLRCDIVTIPGISSTRTLPVLSSHKETARIPIRS